MSKFKGIFTADREDEQPDEALSVPKRGRPKGKRSHPDYEQVSAYIRKETYRKVKLALLQSGEESDFSELVEKLLGEWLDTQNFE